LLSLLVSRDLLDQVTEQVDSEIVFPPERWSATFLSHAQLIFYELGEYLGYSLSPLLERLSKTHRRSTNHDQYYKRRSLPLCNRGVRPK
jgi:hypothetical protein